MTEVGTYLPELPQSDAPLPEDLATLGPTRIIPRPSGLDEGQPSIVPTAEPVDGAIKEPMTNFLVKRAQAGNTYAMEEVCRRAIPFVQGLAQSHIVNKTTSVPHEDLIQAALAELPGIVERFDASRGNQFTTMYGRRAIGAMIDEQRNQMALSRGDYGRLRIIDRISDPEERRQAIHNLVVGVPDDAEPVKDGKAKKQEPFLAAQGLIYEGGGMSVDPESLEALIYGNPDTEYVKGLEPAAPDDVFEIVAERADEAAIEALLASLPERERRAPDFGSPR